MKILITGGAGYLGAVLVPMLLHAEHEVTVVDKFMHGVPSLAAACGHSTLTIRHLDVRSSEMLDLAMHFDALILLAAVVGAGACDRAPLDAVTINREAIRDICAVAHAQRLLVIYPNTNSGYGIGGTAECDETSPLNPVSLYGRTKVEAEEAVLTAGGISLRFATLFGMSPRMRLDLMVNDFVYRAVHDRSLVLFEPRFRRNFLHVRDAALAIMWALNGALERGQAYNCGDSRANMSKWQLCGEIAKIVKGFGWHESAIGSYDPDRRDYVVSNTKIEAKGWRPLNTLQDGITELVRGFTMPYESWRN